MWFVLTVVAVTIAGTLALLSFLLHLMLDKRINYTNLSGRHVVVTGGSSGIGLAAAREAAKLGAHVTIIGRDIRKLSDAVQNITSCAANNSQKVQSAVLDVTSDYEAVEKVLSQLEASVGLIFMLINSAGSCVCGRFEDMLPADIKNLMNLNYLGTAFPTKYVLPGMKSRGEGRIVLVSSEAALLGIYGYSAYSAAKWAVRGLAESLLMELVGTGVHLTLSFPPDTDTPGYHAENETKPIETKLISGTGGLLSSDDVGKQLIKDAMAGKAYSVTGFGGKLMSLLFCGSIESVPQVLLQVFSMGFLRVVIVGFILSFHSIVRGELKKKRPSDSTTKIDDQM